MAQMTVATKTSLTSSVCGFAVASFAFLGSSCVSSEQRTKQGHPFGSPLTDRQGSSQGDDALADRLISVLPETIETSEKFEMGPLGKQIVSILGRPLSETNRKTLIAIRALLVTQRELREQRPSQAREMAKAVLSTSDLSTEIYISALRDLAMADVLVLSDTATSDSAIQRARDPKVEFNAFQSIQCSSACKTKGWEIISREEPQILSVNGYRNRLLSDTQFRKRGLQVPQWLREIWNQSATVQSKEIVVPAATERSETALNKVLKLRLLVDQRQWTTAVTLARTILSERRTSSSRAKGKQGCAADAIYSQYVTAQNSRIQQERKKFAEAQNLLVEEIEKSICQPENFGFDKEQFDSFKLDARIWLARLQWEQNENAQAFHTARMALNEAANNQSWEHYSDAAKVLVGRVGFELLSTSENIALLNSLERQFSALESEEFPNWVLTRKGLLHFLEGDFEKSQHAFDSVIESTTDNVLRSMAFYWKGRNIRARNLIPESENAFLSAGRTDPLSIYDIFSGQMMARESGRASTTAQRAFADGWRMTFDRWMKFTLERPLEIVTSVPTRNISSPRTPDFGEHEKSQRQFDVSLESSLLTYSLVRSLDSKASESDFLSWLKSNGGLLPTLIRSEVSNLRQSFTKLNTLHKDVLPRAHQIAWMTHAIGDHANAILFVGRLRDSLGWDTDYLPFLYFIFYPKPHSSDFEFAAQRCGVDVDLLYSVARQESLFQHAVKSPVGAIGLMQLLPSTAARVLKQMPEFQEAQKFDLTDPKTNTLAGACYLRDLLIRYQNNLAYAVAAYNAGENAVDKWISRREKLPDVPFFIEFIPFAETKTYVQRVLRNYYNFKWIYQDPPKE